MLQQLANEKFLPLYTATAIEPALIAKELLLKHGLHFIEVAYRSELASETIHTLAQCDELIVGAGTVRTLDTAKEALANGAQFIVTPGFSDEITAYCVAHNVPIIPGAVTPTEIMRAASYGLNVVKFFPADIYGGLEAIKVLSGPFFDIQFVPTGGIDQHNCHEFLTAPEILAVGGSFILSEKTILQDNGKTADKILAELNTIKKTS